MGQGSWDPFFLYRLYESGRCAGYRELAAAYCRAAELTADRVGLLACRDLDAVRMKAVLDGAGADADTRELLRTAQEYGEDVGRRRRRSIGDSHPEKAIRMYAIWLFSETDTYEELTGLGSGARSLKEIDWTLARLIGPAESAEDMGLPPEEEPCLLDRARELITTTQERARKGLSTTLRGVLSRRGMQDEEHEHVDHDELDRDPLEDKFIALERELEQRSRDELEQRFSELEGRVSRTGPG